MENNSPRPRRGRPPRPLWQRLDAMTDKSGECWIFTGWKDPLGYGRIGKGGPQGKGRGGSMLLAHRAAWIVTYGEIPDGMIVCHRCDRPSCVRPSHLFLGSHQDNSDDKVSKGRQWDNVGERNPRRVLTEDDVRAIRALPQTYGMFSRLAREYGVTPAAISHAYTGRTWSHVE